MLLRSFDKPWITMIILVTLLLFSRAFAQDDSHECTHAMILGPLSPGLNYIDGSNPILVYHKNKSTTWKMKLYRKGTLSATGDYTYQHTFIGIGMAWNGTYFRGLSAMNEKGNAINFADAYNPIGSDDYYVRERAAALAGNFEELCNLVSPESLPNLVAVAGFDQNGIIKTGYMSQNNFTSVTPENPFIMEGKAAISEGRNALSNTNYWFHGDANRLEVRDVAYCWHRFNRSSDFAVINVPRHNIMWCTAAKTSNSPFIPFDLNDPYVYQAFQDGTYYNSANYTQQQIDEIEDLIMAIDGAVIGDVRDIQMRIAEGLPIITPDVSITSISLPNGIVGETYRGSLRAIGGSPPYTWSLIEGILPDGLTLADDGIITGTPAREEKLVFTVQARDAKNSTDTRGFSINIISASAMLLSDHFENDNDGFNYIDNPFRNTSENNYSDGTWQSSGGFTGGTIQVKLGGIDDRDILGMSGGWQKRFALDVSANVVISFRYNMTMSPDYEGDEFSQVLMSVDNVLYGDAPIDFVVQISGNGDGGNPGTTDWQRFEVSINDLPAGEHILTLGGFNNKKTTRTESTEILIDDVFLYKLNDAISSITTEDDLSVPNSNNSGFEKSNIQIPESFCLYQNYPNPFNPSTLISFDLPFRAKVRLAIFDVLGHKVATIVDDTLLTGSYRLNWSSVNEAGATIPAGVYLYKIEVIEDSYSPITQQVFSVTKKMILMK